jgi:Zn finger protein HypA/HybF involved in hydrogenase expression
MRQGSSSFSPDGGTARTHPAFLEQAFLRRFSAMHLSADELLTQCSNCGAWPMATKAVETGVSWGRLVFKCPRCHRDETRSIAAGAGENAR